MTVALEDFVVRVLASLVLGGLIGFERELHKTAAGLRTVAFVCLGSTIFTIMSVEFGNAGADVARIASQIVVGIGFIGAGVIFQTKDKVFGLTTAASLWVTAAIGIIVGIGELVLATTTTVIVLLVLWLGRFEKKILH